MATRAHPSAEQRRAALSKRLDKSERRMFPLSFAQARLWILDRFQPGNPAYNIPIATSLRGWVDTAVLERSLNEVVHRHEALRTTFEVVDAKPSQVVAPSLHIPLEIVDLRSRPPAARQEEMYRWLFKEGRHAFDLAKGPLLKATLLKLDAANNVLSLVIHHIVSDGWSMSVLYQELSTIYMAFLARKPSPLAELTIQYADFATWQNEWFRGDVLQEQLDYWSKQLEGLRPVLDLPTDRPRPPVQTNRGAVQGFSLRKQLCEDLKEMSQERRATLFMTLIAAFKALLHRLSGETDIAVGSPIANRTRSELEGLIGFFVNTLVLRTDLSGDPTFLELLDREREVALGAYAHQDMPFEKLVEELQPERNLTHNPLFQILFAVQNIGTVDRKAPQLPQSAGGSRPPAIGNGTAKFDLTMSLMDTGGGAQGFLEYNTDLFDDSTVEVIIERYLTLLRGVAENPETRLSRLPILTADEQENPPGSWNGPPLKAVRQEMIGALVAKHSETPAAIAAIGQEGNHLKYAELNRRANKLAHQMLSMDLKPGSAVAVAMTPGLDSLTAAIAVLRAGLAWVPIDASEFSTATGRPLDGSRVAQILDAIRPALVVADESSETCVGPASERLIRFGELEADASAQPEGEPESGATPDSEAAILPQWDAEGQLDAVHLTQRALCRVASDPSLRLGPSDHVAHGAHLASDRARYEIFGTLAAGAAIVFLPRNPLTASRKFASLLRDQAVTVMFVASADLERLAREFPWALRKVRLLLCDEPFIDLKRLRDAINPKILERMCALRGDAAASGFFLVEPLSSIPAEAKAIPMGNPTAGTTVHVLDQNLEPVPALIPGDVYVETESLAHLPSDCADLPESGRRGYRTGDVARPQTDGSLEFQARKDRAMLIAGRRVYPVEIESVLSQHPQVEEAAVAPRSRQRLRDRGIVAFLRLESQIGEDKLRDFLSERLPDAILPTAYVMGQDLPRLPSGALDRKALLDLAAEFDAPKSASEPYVAPRNDLETSLAQIWMETLDMDRVGIKDNFFRLGGHSLIATQVVARTSDAFKIEFPLQRLFEAPTIEKMAEIIEPLIDSDHQPETPPIVHVPRDRPIPLSFAQQRLWFLDQFEPESAFYNIAIPIRFPGPINARVLEGALNDLIARHETLRTTFDTVDDQPVQIIAPSIKLYMPVHDLRTLSPEAREAEAQRLTEQEAQKPFDLRNGPILRAELVRLADNDNLLLLTVHHIAADGWSTDVLFRELIAFYEARQTGKTAAVPELSVQYADYSCWQRRWLTGTVLERQVAYWKRQLEGAPALLELPTDRPRPAVQMFTGGMYMFVTPPSLLEAAKRISEEEQVTLFTTLLSAFYVLLYRYTGCEDLVVGSPIANRIRPELESLIGFFANTLVLRTQTSPSLTFRELIARVRDVTVGAYAHQDIPFEKLVEEIQPKRNLSYNPLFQVMLAMQNTGRPVEAGPAPDKGSQVIGAGVAKFDLTMFVSETANDLRVGIEYNSDLFDSSTIVRLASHFEALLTTATTEPERPIWSLPMLSSEESISLAEWNETSAHFERECVYRLFEAQVDQTPNEPAALFKDEAVSYGDLNRRANAWAHRLIDLGIGPDSCVGVCLERSIDMAVAVLAVLKAGGAYVPLDPNYPRERLAFMLADSRAPIILTQTALLERLPSLEARILPIDGEEAPGEGDVNPVTIASPDNIAYVIYTSGSTGRPKGVAVPHAPLANLVQWQIRRSALPIGARTLQFASLSFDVSFQEFFSTLCAGGTLVLVSESERSEPKALWDVLRRKRVQRLFLAYVALQQLAEHARAMPELPSTLKEVVTAGEQLQITPQIAALFARLDASLSNQYGPTESHVVTELELAGEPSQWPSRPAIGRPIPNATIHVLDTFGQPCGIGTPGELHIGAEALARGYVHQPGATAERFVPDPHSSAGGRLYRTGDLARYLSDGAIQFLGRADDQVKIRGFRVEPGEVEAALRTYPTVHEAAVVAREHGQGELRLAAYVQADPSDPPTSRQLRAHLAARLPEHMIPSAYVVTGALPLTPSGKLNRRALPDPQPPVNERGEAVNPRTPVEESLSRIWRDVLEVPKIDIRDNFFELGGHSLLATRVVSRIRDEFGTELPVRSMFEAPTIEALALAVIESAFESQEDDEMARLLDELEEMPDDQAATLFQGDEA